MNAEWMMRRRVRDDREGIYTIVDEQTGVVTAHHQPPNGEQLPPVYGDIPVRPYMTPNAPVIVMFS